MPAHSTVQNLVRLGKEERKAAIAKARAEKKGKSAVAQRLRGGAGSEDGEEDGNGDDEDEDDRSDVSQVAIAGSPPRTGSGGIHVTVRQKDADRARRFKETEQRSAARNQYWRNRIDRL